MGKTNKRQGTVAVAAAIATKNAEIQEQCDPNPHSAPQGPANGQLKVASTPPAPGDHAGTKHQRAAEQELINSPAPKVARPSPAAVAAAEEGGGGGSVFHDEELAIDEDPLGVNGSLQRQPSFDDGSMLDGIADSDQVEEVDEVEDAMEFGTGRAEAFSAALARSIQAHQVDLNKKMDKIIEALHAMIKVNSGKPGSNAPVSAHDINIRVEDCMARSDNGCYLDEREIGALAAEILGHSDAAESRRQGLQLHVDIEGRIKNGMKYQKNQLTSKCRTALLKYYKSTTTTVNAFDANGKINHGVAGKLLEGHRYRTSNKADPYGCRSFRALLWQCETVDGRNIASSPGDRDLDVISVPAYRLALYELAVEDYLSGQAQVRSDKPEFKEKYKLRLEEIKETSSEYVIILH